MQFAKNIALVVLLMAGFVLAGSHDEGRGQASLDKIQVMLEFFVNPDHAPLYVARDKNFFKDEGLDVSVLVPGDVSQVQQLLAAGRIELALADGLDYMINKTDQDLPIIAVGSLIQHPLGGLLAIKEAGIQKLSDLKGKKIGFSLEPLEPILFQTMLASVGLKPNDYQLVKLAPENLLPSLLAGQLQAIGAFRNFETTAVELERKTPVFFPQEEYGAPDYYQLAVLANEKFAQQKGTLIKKFLRALAKAVLFTLANPNQALEIFFKANPETKDELNKRAFDKTIVLFAGAPCHTDTDRWVKPRDFLLQANVLKKKLESDKLFTLEFLPEGCR
jgi:putative hydroxymethylpyrimidine transport system substrate-binding protein